MQNTFQLRNVGVEVSEADALDDITAILEALYVLLTSILNAVYVINGIRVVNESDNSDVGLGILADSTPGTDAGNRHPPQLAYILNLLTASLSSQGRKYFGPASTGDADTLGLLGGATILALADVGDYMTAQQAAANSTWEFGVFSSVGNIWRPFISYTIGLRLGVQRRRKVGIGI
jgi:hypothetical protein